MKDRILKLIVSALPIKMIVAYVLAELKEYVKKTDNRIDDAVVDAIEKLFEAADISAKGVTLPKEFVNFFKSFDIKDILTSFVSFLEERALVTQNEFDDYLVKVFRAVLLEFGLIHGNSTSTIANN